MISHLYIPYIFCAQTNYRVVNTDRQKENKLIKCTDENCMRLQVIVTQLLYTIRMVIIKVAIKRDVSIYYNLIMALTLLS